MTLSTTEAERLRYRDEPAYSDGFYDAQRGDPLFSDADIAYRAGWEAYWFCRELLESAGFKRSSDGSYCKTTLLSAQERDDGR